MQEIKLAILGGERVGKTSLLTQFTKKKFRDDYNPTIGANFQYVRIDHINSVGFAIWDTSGQERYRVLNHLYTRYADIIILVYSVLNRASFNEILPLLTNIRQDGDIPVILVGNQNDAKNWQVTQEEGESFSLQHHLSFITTSAKCGDGVDQLFTMIPLLKQNNPLNSSDPPKKPKRSWCGCSVD